MQKDFNLKNEYFKKNIYNQIDNSDLPVANIYYIFKDIFKNIESSYFQYINEKLLEETEVEEKKQIVQNFEIPIEIENSDDQVE